MATVYTKTKESINLKPKPLGKGGQGEVYEATNKPLLVAKLFHKKYLSTALKQKIELMVTNPPPEKQSFKHISFAWPKDLIYNASGNFIGYLMPKLSNMKSLYSVLHPKLKPSGFNWQYSVFTAINLATVISKLHKHGCIVGDLNESNIMVRSDASVSVLDCDSMQIYDCNNNKYYYSEVKKDEYLPPELQKVDLKQYLRHEYHDNFTLAVLIFQLLMNGVNPYFGSGSPTPKENIANNFSFVINNKIKPPSGTPSLNRLPNNILNQFKACFSNGFQDPRFRPTAQDWINELNSLKLNIAQCNAGHYYSKHQTSCPNCQKRKPRKNKVSIPKINGILKTSTQAQNHHVTTPQVVSQSLAQANTNLPVNTTQSPEWVAPVVGAGISALFYGGVTVAMGLNFWVGTIIAPILFLLAYFISELENGKGWSFFWGIATPAIVIAVFYIIVAILPILLFVFLLGAFLKGASES